MSGQRPIVRLWTADGEMVVCHEEVARSGEFAPCDKPAVGYALDDERSAYPVCNRHLPKGLQP
ncbi:hypothetical protein [Mycobacteroides chelonae]|jgi:hypothetical protein|uniref:hypothetical protein n=1 Tax=Mycobacteroides chelonae TaxID=1774 RepID=UPI001041E0C9|nr:hypothetical protein [Mycobacteroides chelonae]